MSPTKKLTMVIVVLFALGYWLSPLDAVPDIPVIGHFDDILIPLLVAWAGGLIGSDQEAE